MEREFFIRNLEGTLYYTDTPVFEFIIKDCKIIHFKDLSGRKFYPPEIYTWGVETINFTEFFRRRVVPYYAMDSFEYVKGMGLERYDFEELIKRNNGWNHVDLYWLKMNGIGANSWEEIQTQDYPIYR